MPDTGRWKALGKVWSVVQKKDGSVVCYSGDWMTAARADTWALWKKFHGWVQVDPA